MTILLAQPEPLEASIPDWVKDIQSFRRWACTAEYPTSGSYAHLNGNLWVDTNMESLTHNQIKSEISMTLGQLTKADGSGRFLNDRMLLTNLKAKLSTEPDAMFLGYESLRTGRAELKKGKNSLEVEGTPDMVLEVVSNMSKRKDTIVLPKLYHAAGIREYWIAEHRGESPTLEILVWKARAYKRAASADGWTASPMFGKSFRLTHHEDEMGLPVYALQSR
jgi:Uma2 family endonuclease